MDMLPVSLLEKIARDFPADERDEIVELLSCYGRESWEREKSRVLLDILCLASGRREELRELVERAKRDYRDIIMWAEYAEQAQLDSPAERAAFDEMYRKYGIDLREGR